MKAGASAQLLEVKNLKKRFGGLTVLRDLDLDVFESEILGIIGPQRGRTSLDCEFAGNVRWKTTSRRAEIRGQRAGRQLADSPERLALITD